MSAKPNFCAACGAPVVEREIDVDQAEKGPVRKDDPIAAGGGLRLATRPCRHARRDEGSCIARNAISTSRAVFVTAR
ncbi:MAG: hypothetical protein H7Y32_05010 [Chloroflexales bacterium]|nr:hypothetical protein [Chloroflexales bacterium]